MASIIQYRTIQLLILSLSAELLNLIKCVSLVIIFQQWTPQPESLIFEPGHKSILSSYLGSLNNNTVSKKRYFSEPRVRTLKLLFHGPGAMSVPGSIELNLMLLANRQSETCKMYILLSTLMEVLHSL